jgi:hypothetical protein
VAQWIRRLPTEQEIHGSSPCSGNIFIWTNGEGPNFLRQRAGSHEDGLEQSAHRHGTEPLRAQASSCSHRPLRRAARSACPDYRGILSRAEQAVHQSSRHPDASIRTLRIAATTQPSRLRRLAARASECPPPCVARALSAAPTLLRQVHPARADRSKASGSYCAVRPVKPPPQSVLSRLGPCPPSPPSRRLSRARRALKGAAGSLAPICSRFPRQ